MSISIEIVHDITEDGNLNEAQQYIVEEFREYKANSLAASQDNFCTPNEETDQRENASLHPFFGRDRIFDFPKRILAQIWHENLAHIHIDTDGEWEVPSFQWFTTSRNALIYSAFIHDDDYVFVVLDILNDFDDSDNRGAHNYYSEEDIKHFLELAEWHRINYPHEEQFILQAP